MKKSHQRSMKLAVLPCMIAVALSISGCTFSEINKMQKKAQEDSAHAREKVSALSARKSQALTWLDNQWINPVPVAQVSREKRNDEARALLNLRQRPQEEDLGHGTAILLPLSASRQSRHFPLTRAASSALREGATHRMERL
uniref:PilN family type IVB pilus formation outer membrane protein n=1 Tax=Salmonella enterica subsp. enterica serovar Meleagridis TaxID=486999 RepID=A0A8B0SQJ1_SALET|nr:hypothetical protein GNKKMDEE_00098 [Salmonella enterica subsp. enterica serovar Meleagridis]